MHMHANVYLEIKEELHQGCNDAVDISGLPIHSNKRELRAGRVLEAGACRLNHRCLQMDPKTQRLSNECGHGFQSLLRDISLVGNATRHQNISDRTGFAQNFGFCADPRGTGHARVQAADVMTTSNCEQRVKPQWR